MIFRTATNEFAFSGTRRILDYVELTKPRMVLMILVTTCVGFYLGSSAVADYLTLMSLMLGTALAAGGTLALNQSFERETDALMHRTRQRPLPDGRVQPAECVVFALIIMGLGLAVLLTAVNVLCALLTAIVVVTYLFLYTPLKQVTPLCTVVGALPGALPPMIGWAAARDTISLEAWVLFALLYLWQIPHNLAIARLYRDDFARGGIRFLPVHDVRGQTTGLYVVTYCLALLAASLLPTLIGLTGMVYYVFAIVLGLGYLLYGVRMALVDSVANARSLLFASLVYLPVLFLVMAADRVPLPGV